MLDKIMNRKTFDFGDMENAFELGSHMIHRLMKVSDIDRDGWWDTITGSGGFRLGTIAAAACFESVREDSDYDYETYDWETALMHFGDLLFAYAVTHPENFGALNYGRTMEFRGAKRTISGGELQDQFAEDVGGFAHSAIKKATWK